MKVAKVRRTINGRREPRAEYSDVIFDMSEDRQVTLLTADFSPIAEGCMHAVHTSANFSGFHIRLELMVKAREASNNPGDVHPGEFDYETWYIAFYPAGQDKP